MKLLPANPTLELTEPSTERFIKCADNKNNMKREIINISKEEYKRLKKLEKIDWDLVQSFKNSLEDLKEGRIRRVK